MHYVFIDAWLEIIEKCQHQSFFSVMEKTCRAPFYLKQGPKLRLKILHSGGDQISITGRQQASNYFKT